jgi:hypothetical protein
MAKGKKLTNLTIDWQTWSRFRLNDRGIKVRNSFRTYRIGWDEVRLFTDGSMRGRLGSRWWVLRIVLHDGRAITAAETSNRRTAADPEVLSAIRQAAEQHAVPAELTGMPPGSSPGAVTIADRGWWAWARLRLDDDGIVVRNFLSTDRIEWDDVRWFADGQVGSGDSRGWALAIVLRNGYEITASGTSNKTGYARAGTLTAIRQAAERHAIPAVLTGTLLKSGEPDLAGLYRDPGGKPGLREWTGTEWSPFLKLDPAGSGPEGEKGPANVWSPLPEEEQQRQREAAALRARGAGLWFGLCLTVTAVAGAVMLAIFVYDVGQPRAGLRWAGWGLFYLGCGGLITWGARTTRNRRRKADQAAKRAAELAGAMDSAPNPPDDPGATLAARESLAGQPSATDPAAGTVRIRCLECGRDCAGSARFCARCGAPLPAPQPSLAGNLEEGGPPA